MRTRVIREVDGVYDLLARQFSSQQSLYKTHIYIVPQALQGKHRSLTAHIAEGDVRLDAQDATAAGRPLRRTLHVLGYVLEMASPETWNGR